MMNANGQVFFHPFTARRTILRRESGGNFYQLLSGAFCLLSKYVEEISDCDIVHLLGEYAARHTQNVQSLNRYQIVVFYKIVSDFVLKIVSLVFDFLMNLSELHNRFAAAVTAFLASGHSALCNSEFLLSRFVIFEIVYLRPVAQGQKRRNSSIQTNGLTCFRQWFGSCFNREDHKPFSAFAFNLARLNFALNFAGKFYFERSEFGKRHFVSRQRKTTLRKGKAVVSADTSESRKARFLTFFHAIEKSLKGKVNPFQNILQNLRMNFFVFGVRLFNCRQLVLLVLIIYRNAIDLIRFFAFLQSGIIQIFAKAQSIIEFLRLSFIRFEGKAKGFYNCFRHSNQPLFDSVFRGALNPQNSLCLDFYYTPNRFHNSILNNNLGLDIGADPADAVERPTSPTKREARYGRRLGLIPVKRPFRP